MVGKVESQPGGGTSSEPFPNTRPVLPFDPKNPRCLDSWMDSLRSACQTSPPRGDWIPFRFFGSLFMKLFLHALANQEQHNFGPIPHLFPWPSMTAVCGVARRAQACTRETQHLGHFTGLPMCSFSFPLKQRIVSNWE